MMYRLPARNGEWIDRGRTLRFTFEGTAYEGFAGDTLTSALAAAGVMITARSFKYHRPARRVLRSGPRCEQPVPGGRGAQPARRCRAARRWHGLHCSEHLRRRCKGSRLAHGAAVAGSCRWASTTRPAAGTRTFPWFEKLIRHMSGLGRIDFAARPPLRDRRHLHADVVIVGAGLSGLNAALAAARAGAARVVLVDENAKPGGCALHGADDSARARR